MNCTNCGATVTPGQACPNCGVFAGATNPPPTGAGYPQPGPVYPPPPAYPHQQPGGPYQQPGGQHFPGQQPQEQWGYRPGGYAPTYQGPTYAGYDGRRPEGTNGFSIASLACSVLGLVTLGIGGVLGIIFGVIALRQIDRSGGRSGGRRLAIAGLVVGTAMVLLGVLAAIGLAVGKTSN